MAVWISLLSLAVINSICVTVWWNTTACSLGSGFTLFNSTTWSRCSAAGVAEDDLISSGNPLSILPMCLIIYTLKDNFLE